MTDENLCITATLKKTENWFSRPTRAEVDGTPSQIPAFDL